MRHRVVNIAAVAVVCWSSSAAFAGWPCSIDHAYPEISTIEVDGDGITLTLGAYFGDEYTKRIVLHGSFDDGWARQPGTVEIGYLPDAAGCSEPIDPPLDENWLLNRTDYERFKRDFNQDIGACASDGNAIWAGTSFYGGEGSWGVGALIRKDLESGAYHYFHDLSLQPYSTNYLEFFANQLWIGTTHRGECGGPAYGFGIMRFDMRREYVYKVPEVCGFTTRAMMVHDERLWVATDLGLSVASASEDGTVVWRNYVPDLDDERLLRPVQCHALYEELLRSERIATDTAFDMGYAFEDFWRRLSNLRPEFTRSYLRKIHNHPGWAWPEY